MFSGTKCLSLVSSVLITPRNLVELTLFNETPSSLMFSLTFTALLECVDSESLMYPCPSLHQ